MRTSLLLSLLLWAFSANAQEGIDLSQIDQPRSGVSSRAFKGANQIVVIAPDSGEVAFKKVLFLLQDAGLMVEKRDNELLSFATEYQQTSKAFIHEHSISGYVRGNVIYLTSRWKMNRAGTFAGTAFTSQYGTSSGNQSAKAFRIMESVAQQYPGAKLVYLVK